MSRYKVDAGSILGVGDQWRIGKVELHYAPPQPLPPYDPPLLPDFDAIPEPGALPPGSRIPFSRNATFTGRERELLVLARRLLAIDNRRVRPLAQIITGMGGVGKTQLAVELAYRYGRFLDGVHWIDATEEERIPADIADCGVKMTLPDWPADLEDQVNRTLRAWASDRRRLVVFDALEDVATARAWLPRIAVGNLAVLVISRSASWPADLGLETLEIASFTPEEALVFLRRFRPDDPEADLNELASTLGGLPLALELAGRYLSEYRDLPVGEYRDELLATHSLFNHKSVSGWFPEAGNPTDHSLDLRATFELSWQRVVDANAQAVFMMAGYCASDHPIPRFLFQQALENLRATPSGALAQECSHALRLLARLSLLTLHGETGEATMHRLLSLYARSLDNTQDSLCALSYAMILVTRDYNEKVQLRDFEALGCHVQQVAASAESAGLYLSGELWHEFGFHLHQAGQFARSRSMLERALSLNEPVWGPDHPAVAANLNSLGMLLVDQDEYEEAKSLVERAMVIYEGTDDIDDTQVAITAANLADILRHLDALGAARIALLGALEIAERHTETNQALLARILNGLGLVLQEQGDFAGAEDRFRRALKIGEAGYGRNHPNYAIDLNNLASVWRSAKRYVEAIAAHEEALGILITELGETHILVARCLDYLARTLWESGQRSKARTVIQRAGDLLDAILGPDHVRSERATVAFGWMSLELELYGEARDAFNRAISVRESREAGRDREIATYYSLLAQAMHSLNDPDAAREMYEQSLDIGVLVRGSRDPWVAGILASLAIVNKDLGDLDAAERLAEQALDIYEESLGPDDPAVARVLNIQALILGRRGNLRRARWLLQRAVRIDERAFGPESRGVAADLNNLGMVLRDMANPSAARRMLERALAIDRKIFGEEHREVAIDMNNLSTILRALGDTRGADSMLHQARRIFGGSVPSTPGTWIIPS